MEKIDNYPKIIPVTPSYLKHCLDLKVVVFFRIGGHSQRANIKKILICLDSLLKYDHFVENSIKKNPIQSKVKAGPRSAIGRAPDS